MERDDTPSPGGQEREPVEELKEEVDEENPDPQTRREAFELELMEEGRSDEGEEVGDEID